MTAAAATATQASTKLSFERAETLVFDAVPTNRGTARTALGMLGFQQLTATSVFGEVATTLSDKTFDLFVADVTQDASVTCDLVRRIRDGSIGRNPFLHIVLMTWKLDGDIVERALNCGADDLITRPFSVDFLGARLRAHAENRKAFAITSDYIGPDRRKGRVQPSNVQLIDVPNLLLAKGQESRWSDKAEKAAHDAIKAARGKVNVERACRSAFQLAVLVQSLRDGFKTMASLDSDLVKIEETAKDLAMRVEGRDGEMEILQLISAMRGDVAGAQGGENVAGHIDSMDETSSSLLEKITPGRGRELAQEAARAFAGAKSRGRKA